MNLKSIAVPLFALGIVSGCSDNPAPVNSENTQSAEINSSIIEEPLQPIEEYNPSKKYPYSENHGECYMILLMRESERGEEAKPVNFDEAKNYYANRIAEEFNLYGENLQIGLHDKSNEYFKRMWDKYGPVNLSETMPAREIACIAIAETEFTPQ